MAIDLVVGVTALEWLHASSRAAAMVGTLVGATWTYFANRGYAFTDGDRQLRRSAVRFVFTTIALSAAHGQAVVLLRDRWGVPYVPAKIVADVVVLTFTQLILYRFFVFPRPAAPRPVEGQAVQRGGAQASKSSV